MRLICPNCDAQYDIADDVIPEGGRDVQCSSCTHTWFQTDKPKVAGRRAILTPTPTPPAKSKVPSPPGVPGPTRKTLDSSIADILREEAGREHDVPAPGTATPPKPPKPIPTPEEDRERADETRRRVSRLTEESIQDSRAAASTAAASTGAVAGTNLRTMPSIDEINATLRARSEESDDSGLTEVEQKEVVERRGFRRSFAFVLILIALAFAPYFFAAEIVARFPETRDFMVQYVEIVNDLRLQVRDLAGQARAMIDGMINGA